MLSPDALAARPARAAAGTRAARRLQALLLAALLALVGLLANPARAELPPPLSATLSDFADVLQAEEETAIVDALLRLRADPGVEVAVVTIGSPADYDGPADLPGFAKALFNAWGIGDAERHDGVLILLAMADREVRIALGAGYPPVWDGRAHRVIEVLMLPSLAAGDIGGAVLAGLQGLESDLLRPYRGGQAPTETAEPSVTEDGGALELVLFLGVAALAGVSVLWRKRFRLGDRLARHRPCPRCGRYGVVVSETPVTAPHVPDTTSKTEPEDAAEIAAPLVATLIQRRCPQCGWQAERSEGPPPDSPAQETGGSDGGGFGGGQSSGGGASGRW